MVRSLNVLTQAPGNSNPGPYHHSATTTMDSYLTLKGYQSSLVSQYDPIIVVALTTRQPRPQTRTWSSKGINYHWSASTILWLLWFLPKTTEIIFQNLCKSMHFFSKSFWKLFQKLFQNSSQKHHQISCQTLHKKPWPKVTKTPHSLSKSFGKTIFPKHTQYLSQITLKNHLKSHTKTNSKHSLDSSFVRLNRMTKLCQKKNHTLGASEF